MRRFVLVAAAALVLAAPAGGTRPGFSAHVTNRFFPLAPGTTKISIGHVDGKRAKNVFRVTHRTAVIDGAPCVVVDDRLYLNGKLVERTTDWYSQDAKGTVWYFGENTAELDANGRVVTTEGTWRAGRNGARPGVFMPAHPSKGQVFQQEHARGVAEDHFRIVSVIIGGGKDTVETREWTPLEPGVVERKTYVLGIGTDIEQTVKGGDDYLELIQVRHD